MLDLHSGAHAHFSHRPAAAIEEQVHIHQQAESYSIAHTCSVWGELFTYCAGSCKGDCGCPLLICNGRVLGLHVSVMHV